MCVCVCVCVCVCRLGVELEVHMIQYVLKKENKYKKGCFNHRQVYPF
jgi:hypothetical protein